MDFTEILFIKFNFLIVVIDPDASVTGNSRAERAFVESTYRAGLGLKAVNQKPPAVGGHLSIENIGILISHTKRSSCHCSMVLPQ